MASPLRLFSGEAVFGVRYPVSGIRCPGGGVLKLVFLLKKLHFPIFNAQISHVMGKFKQLRVWQEAVDLAVSIYQLSNQKPFSKDFGLRNQIQRAATSISSNIAEGDERGTNREAIYFFNVAKGSAAETISQLHIAHRIGYIDRSILDRLEDQAEKIGASLNNLIKARR
jgi:four helix bundle protein